MRFSDSLTILFPIIFYVSHHPSHSTFLVLAEDDIPTPQSRQKSSPEPQRPAQDNCFHNTDRHEKHHKTKKIKRERGGGAAGGGGIYTQWKDHWNSDKGKDKFHSSQSKHKKSNHE